MNKLSKATHNGELNINGIKIICAVLDDETRVISERSLAIALGVRGGGAYWEKRKGSKSELPLPEYISANYLQPFVSEALKERLSKSISYISKAGKIAKGYDATVLPDICDVWIKAKQKKAIPAKQESIAEHAYILLKGFAHIGIIALIDEATGYQLIREKNALKKFLDKFLLEEHAKWIKTFPDEFFEVIFKMKNWNWEGMAKSKRPQVIGHYINNFIYARLAPQVLKELKILNPTLPDKGYRKYKHPQLITPDYGHPLLKEHLHAVIALSKSVGYNWRNFQRAMNRAFPKFGHSFELNFPDEILE